MEAGLGGGKYRGELGVVFAEVVCREEEVVEVGFDAGQKGQSLLIQVY